MPRNHEMEPKAYASKLASYSSVVVTGGLTFVGGHLVRALTRLGKRIVVDSAVPENDASGLSDVELRRTDLRDHEQAVEAVNGADLVFHLAGNSSGTLSVSRPRFDFETNAVGTFNVVHTSAASGGWYICRP